MVQTFIVEGKKYFVGNEIAKELGYKRTRDAIHDHVFSQNKITVQELKSMYNEFECKLQPKTYLIDEIGVKSLIIKTRQPGSIEYAKKYNIDITNCKVACKEATTLSHIMKAFDGETMQFQKCVGRYRIDLYFHDYNLAVECDEFGHLDRKDYEEKERQQYLEETLKCKFIRFNPDEPNFNIFSVINQVMKHILSKK